METSQVLYLDLNAGLGGKGVGELLNLGLLAPVADLLTALSTSTPWL